MAWTITEIEALASRRGLTRLTPDHLAQWLAAANAQPDTTPLRDAVARKEDEPAYGPEAFPFSPAEDTSMESAVENYRGLYEHKVGYGTRPAIVAIDFVRAYTTKTAPFFGQGVVDAVAETVELFAAARAAGVPIIHTRPIYHPTRKDGGMFMKKIPALRAMVQGEPMAEFDPKVAPDPEDLVFEKTYPSSFFATPLASTLISFDIDTLILVGCSTSGCVRATAVDGIQYGYRVIVPRECVGDRHPAPHDASLFDINAKYGDVVSKAEAIAYLARLSGQDAERDAA